MKINTHGQTLEHDLTCPSVRQISPSDGQSADSRDRTDHGMLQQRDYARLLMVYGVLGSLATLVVVTPLVFAAPNNFIKVSPLNTRLQAFNSSQALKTTLLRQLLTHSSSIFNPMAMVKDRALILATHHSASPQSLVPQILAQTLPTPPPLANPGQFPSATPAATPFATPAARPFATPAATPFATPAPTPFALPAPAQTQAPNPWQPSPQPLVPNPQITIQDSRPNTGSALPPLLPQAVPPPLGDVSTTTIDASPGLIDLGTNNRISVAYRDTAARDVLSTLVSAAGLNFAYTGDASGGNLPPGQVISPGNIGGQVYDGPKISVVFKDESVQVAFNTVLQLTNFSANRIGNTIVVGPALPNGSRNLFSRSFRLNQVSVATALNFFVGLGAESAISKERTVTTVNAVPVGANFGDGNNQGAVNSSVATQTQTSTESRVEVQRVAFQDAAPLLRGLQVIADERTNTITFVGSTQQIQVATQHLRQLDIRRRQAIINVRIVDVNLTAINSLNSSFSFGVNDTFTSISNGSAVINFGRTRPPLNSEVGGIPGTTNSGSIFSPPLVDLGAAVPNPLQFTRSFLGRLQASIVSGSSKILTDPTLTVQEGQTAQVNLTQEVFGGLMVQQSATGAGGAATLTTQTPIIKQAGLTVSIKLDRIDDNGFLSLSVAPTVSAPNGTVNAGTSGTITLLSQRSLTSGQIRLRDGQTLILAGIIQDADRASVTKVPILGDLPLLGTLFRSTSKDGQRQEVIVLLTPQIIDDSDRANFGYGYQPSPNADPQILRDRKLNPQRKK